MPQFELKITATGVVRDADGNVVSSEPVEAIATITEDQARRLGYIPEEQS